MIVVKEILMPVLGETTDEAEILEWFKNPGDEIKRGEKLLEVQSDKVTVEVPALVSGVMEEIVAQVGETIAVGAVIAKLKTESDARVTSTKKPQTTNDKTKPESALLSATAEVIKTPKKRAAPAARRLAREHDISLAGLKGTGPLGRVTKADVQKEIEKLKRQQEVQRPRPATAAHFSQQSLSHIEKIAGKRTQLSFNQSPHFYVKLKIDITKIRSYLKSLAGNKPSLNDVLILATAKTLVKHPRLNSIFKEDYLQLQDDINIGVITATEQGLYTVVVKNANRLSLGEVKLKVKEIRQKLENNGVTQSEIEGASFTISNLGMFGVDEFSAIILPPNVAIMAVGAAKEELIVRNGQMTIGETLICTISADHRALDGVAVAKFLKDLEGFLTQPERWLF